MSESCSPGHVVVRRELHQLLTWATGNGVFVQVPINAIKWEGNVLIHVRMKFDRLIVVVVKKQFVLNILRMYLWNLLCSIQSACAILYFDPCLVSLCRIFYIIWNTALFSKNENRECVSWFFTKLSWKISYF
jgi:hypothetical protein